MKMGGCQGKQNKSNNKNEEEEDRRRRQRIEEEAEETGSETPVAFSQYNYNDEFAETAPFRDAVLAIPKEIEHLCDGFKFYNIWLVAALSRTQMPRFASGYGAEEAIAAEKRYAKSSIGKLNYQVVERILGFAASEIRFKCQQTWDGERAGSTWGGAPDIVFTEMPYVDPRSRGGIRIRLQIQIKTILEDAKFTIASHTGAESQLRKFAPPSSKPGWTLLSWKDEPGAGRDKKPETGEIKFVVGNKWRRGGDSDLMIHGFVVYPMEGPIGQYGRLRTYDKKTGRETTGGPIIQYYGV